jgi:hypothetical protein
MALSAALPIALIAVGAVALAQQTSGPLVALAELSARDSRALDEGEVISRAVDSDADQETVSVHVARVAVPVAHVVSIYADPGMALETASAIEFGEFSQPPAIGDLAHMTLEDRDLSEFAGCRPRDCKLKLDENWMRRLSTEIDWDEEGADEAGLDLYRTLLTEYALDYATRGNIALTHYADKDEVVHVAQQFEEILREFGPLCEAYPELCLYLRVPYLRPEGLTSRLLWLKEDIGTRRKSSTIVEQVLYRPPGADTLIVATKQLYANHYHEASLAITRVSATPGSSGNTTEIVHVLRARIDALRGWGLLHGRIRKGVRNGLGDRMEQLQRRLEDHWARVAPTLAR